MFILNTRILSFVGQLLKHMYVNTEAHSLYYACPLTQNGKKIPSQDLTEIPSTLWQNTTAQY